MMNNEVSRKVVNDAARRVTVIVPSYQPDEKLEKVVSGLEEMGFDDIIVVDDGSSQDKKHYFPSPDAHPAMTLLLHPENRGKGAALKTAFEYFINNRADRVGVVTADGDAQHRPQDVLLCAERMVSEGNKLVLGVRDFSLSHVPVRSRVGNRITSAVFLIHCGLRISDTQTGLRAIPTEYIESMLQVNGHRYEYETNMLLAMKGLGIKCCEEKIETVYIEENQTSHFRPVRDSLRIYSLIIKFCLSSAAASIIDILAFYLLIKFLTPHLGAFQELICTAIARAISSVCNFAINRKVVFHSGESCGKTLVKYYILAIPVMLISGGCVTLLSDVFMIQAAWIVTALKAVVDFILYLVNFRIQREWVFAKKTKNNDKLGK